MMEAMRDNNAHAAIVDQRSRLLSYFVGSSSPIISKLISALISFGCFVTSFVFIVLYRLISIAKIQKYRLLSYLYIKIMAKEIKFNIKLNIDGKEQLVSATSSVANLREVVNATRTEIQKTNTVLMNFNQHIMKFHYFFKVVNCKVFWPFLSVRMGKFFLCEC